MGNHEAIRRRFRVTAKLVVLVLASIVAGLAITSRTAQSPWRDVLGAGLLLFAAAGAYEAMAHGIAWLLRRLIPGGHAATEAGAGGNTAGEVAQRLEPPPVRRLRPADGAALLGTYLAAQFFVWLIVGISVAISAGASEPADIERNLLRAAPVALPLSMVLGAIAVLVVFRSRLGKANPVLLREQLAWRPGTRAQVALGAAAGLAAAAAFIKIGPRLAPLPDPSSLGIMSRMAGAGGSARLALTVAAVALAPPIEEFLFRGSLLGSLFEQFGVVLAVTITTLLFVAVHAPDILSFWPALGAIFIVALAAAVIRLRTGALGPSIALHATYNLMLTLTAYGLHI
jgi:membrane protease YdiL (CAAX protease family)